MATVLTPAEIKQKITDWITTNGQGDITGAHLNTILAAIMDYVGVGYALRGTAPASAPSPDVPSAYLAGPGTYTNYESGDTVIPEGSIAVLKYDGSAWSKSVIKVCDPVSVSQNTKTGHIDITVGSTTTPLPSVDDLSSDNIIEQGTDYSQPQSGIVSTHQTVGSDVLTSSGSGFVRILTKIPIGVIAKVEFSSQTGAYGYALCDGNDKVLEYCANTGLQSYTFKPQSVESNLWISSEKTNKVYLIYPDSLKEKVVILDNDVNKNSKDIADVKSNIYSQSGGNALNVKNTYSNVVLYAHSGRMMNSIGAQVYEYDVAKLTTVMIHASAFSSNLVAAAAFFRPNGSLIESYFNGSSETVIDAILRVPQGATLLRLSSRENFTPTAKKVNDLLNLYTKGEIDEQLTFVDSETADITVVDKSIGYIHPNQQVGDTIVFTESSGYGGIAQCLDIPANSIVTVVFSAQTGAYGYAMCDDNDKILEIVANTGLQSYTFAKTTVPARLYVSKEKYASASRLTVDIKTVKEAIIELREKTYPNSGHWQGKRIWWCGTSIPAGSDATLGSDATIAGNYPTQVGNNLGADVINKAVGGSMCRANVRTGDYVGANFANITSALSMTKAEIENFITNYATIKPVLTGNVPASLGASDIARLRAASFEDRLLPYLDGTYDMPDLFVIDHGHNDFKYTLSGGSSDIGLQPTVANIGGELAEDTYMTANNNEKLESFFGSLANIPSGKKADFIASVNRNCYIGSINFIVTLILRYNPHARIVFISNYEYENGANPSYAPLIPAQESIAKSWALPLCKVYEYLGYSNHIIPNTMAWFNTQYSNVTPATTDVTVYRAYLPDTVHPHSDITGDANVIYAGIIADYIKNIR